MRFESLSAVLAAVLSLDAAPCARRSLSRQIGLSMDEIIACDRTPRLGCDRAMKLFEACADRRQRRRPAWRRASRRNAKRDFLDRLKEPAKSRPIEREMRLCDRKYRNESGTMYLSFTAFCRAEVARRLLASGAAKQRRHRATSAARLRPRARALAFSAIAWNAAGSVMARSDSTLRSTVMPDLARPSIKTAVGHAERAHRRVDALDPERAEGALLALAVAEGVLARPSPPPAWRRGWCSCGGRRSPWRPCRLSCAWRERSHRV